jgi:electron transfer flavoprotein alpha subunit
MGDHQMSNVLIFCEHKDGKLKTASLPAITWGREVAKHTGGQVYGVLMGPGAAAAAADAARFLSKAVTVEDGGLEKYLAETYATALSKAVKDLGVSHLGATSTNLAKDLFPRASALIGAGMISEVIGVKGPKAFIRPTNAGNALGVVEVLTPVVVATVRQTEFAPAEALPAAGGVESASAGPLSTLGAEYLGVKLSESSRPDLSEAKVVVSGGRGMKNGENFKVLEELTDLFGGALGATRAACDAGYVPNDLQVGQTGKVVAPDLYIAVGISGAIQHLAGMKGSKVIVAVNKDEEAPIFQVADYGLVSTWEAAMPEIIAGVKKAKG